jgi:hypothetical protein
LISSCRSFLGSLRPELRLFLPSDRGVGLSYFACSVLRLALCRSLGRGFRCHLVAEEMFFWLFCWRNSQCLFSKLNPVSNLDSMHQRSWTKFFHLLDYYYTLTYLSASSPYSSPLTDVIIGFQSKSPNDVGDKTHWTRRIGLA